MKGSFCKLFRALSWFAGAPVAAEKGKIMKDGIISSICLAGVAALCTSVAAASEQLANLPDTPTATRFTLTDRVWPVNPGEASICLWEDDKFAAMSFTIDDFSPANVAWWLSMSEQYGGFKISWMVVTERFGGSSGSWDQVQPLLDMGHDVQSHSVTHDNGDAEYRDSQAAIEANVPGHKCDFLAYPGGSAHPADRIAAAIYYAAARGGAARINTANKTDYFNINASSAGGLTTNPPANQIGRYLPNLFNASDLRFYRGWFITISHITTDQSVFDTVSPTFEFYAAHKEDIWGGTFGNIAKYGQERDTATLTVTTNTADLITMTLGDRMLDSRFDYPLTIKVRLPACWPAVQASQNGATIESRIIERDGANYALVKAVPDRGQIKLIPTAAPGFSDTDSDGLPDDWELQYFGGITNVVPSAMAANGINTIYETYVARLNPTNPDSRFTVSNDWNSLHWNAVSGRVYSVYWTTNLLNGFQPLETNILWPQNSWTGQVENSQDAGFYRVQVRLG